MFDEDVPGLSNDLALPLIHGAAPIAARLTAGEAVESVVADLAGPFGTEAEILAASFDTSLVAMLSGRRELGMSLQMDVLGQCRMFRTRRSVETADTLRVLGFAAPGDLQMNLPVEFITSQRDIRLDLLFVVPGEALPVVVPDHDVAICLISDSDPDALMRLSPILARWQRPVVNDPGRVAMGRIEDLTRDGVARLFEGDATIHAPVTVSRRREEIAAHLDQGRLIGELLPGAEWPLLVRPVGSHAGSQLEHLRDADELAVYLDAISAERFYLSAFIDYRGTDGLFRKLRVAMISGQPFLCHMALSRHWMIHYVNAGMLEDEAKRAEEARAMAGFATGFAIRHAEAFRRLHQRLGLDYVVLDCAEGPDGRLLLFEVEMAAIVHALDAPDMFPYKVPQMQAVFSAFDSMMRSVARRTAGQSLRAAMM